MPKARSASAEGLEPHFKVRIVVDGALLHAASWTEPELVTHAHEYVVDSIEADWINDPNYGDTIGFLNLDAISGTSWRYSS